MTSAGTDDRKARFEVGSDQLMIIYFTSIFQGFQAAFLVVKGIFFQIHRNMHA
jgi:hypothetical protein